MNGPVLKLEAVTRRFGGVLAVDAATVELLPGEIHAIVGENGAGKSTLLKLAAGALVPSSGVVRVEGAPLEPATPGEAIRRGIGMVHQHFMLIGAFRAIENVILGSEPVLAGGRLDMDRARARVQSIMESARLSVPLDAVTDTLTVGERQRLEILRVLYRGASALLLDEPTAVLSPLEAEDLYETLRRLASDGNTVAVVTHRLDEVARWGDRVTVMRRGAVVLTKCLRRKEESERTALGHWSSIPLSINSLTRAVMGGEAAPEFTPPPLAADAPAKLEIARLALVDGHGHRRLDGLDLTIRAGEIVGIAGVEGNGQRELVRALAGLEPRATGRVTIAGRDLTDLGVRARRASLGVVHEDRHVDGLVLDATVGDNLVLGDAGDDGGEDEASATARRIAHFRVEPPDPSRLACELSGGNQQKIVLARALDRIAKGEGAVAVLAQPTRGVDVGAAATIHAAIGDAAARGLAILVISADLAELHTLCHRIVVMRRGAIVATFAPDASDTEIGRAMLGMEAA